MNRIRNLLFKLLVLSVQSLLVTIIDYVLQNNGNKETSEGQLVLRPGDEAILLSTEESGYIGGFINLTHVAGPNEVEVSILLRTPIPSDLEKDEGLMNEYLYEKYTISRTEGEDFYPIFDIESVFAPYGGIIKMKLTSGLKSPFYFHLYRR